MDFLIHQKTAIFSYDCTMVKDWEKERRRRKGRRQKFNYSIWLANINSDHICFIVVQILFVAMKMSSIGMMSTLYGNRIFAEKLRKAIASAGESSMYRVSCKMRRTRNDRLPALVGMIDNYPMRRSKRESHYLSPEWLPLSAFHRRCWRAKADFTIFKEGTPLDQ